MRDKDAQPAPWLNVLVLHWEDSEALSRCLDFLAGSDHPNLRVLVIENGSSSTHRNAVTRISLEARVRFRWLHLLQLETNLGYVGGNNAGLAFLNRQQLAGDLCILNPDVAVGPGTLSSMVAARTPGVGLVMCSAISEAGDRLYDRFILSGFHQTSAMSSLPVVDTDYAQGACLLIQRELAGETLFDERFFLYWEEVDLSLRIRNADHRIVSSTAAPVMRSRNELSRLPTAIYYSARNAWLLRQKYPTQFTIAGYILYIVRLAVISLKLVGQRNLLFAAWTSLRVALWDAAAGRYGMRAAGRRGLVPRAPEQAVTQQIFTHPGKVSR